MKARLIRKLLATLAALALMSGVALAQQMKVTIASAARPACATCRPCWPSSLANTKRPASRSRLVDFKGGSQALTAVIGGSADVVSGYFDHCVNLAAKNQAHAVVRGL